MDDDDLGDQGKKTNASPVHKPAHARQYDMAPPGSVGRRAGGLPGVANQSPEEQHQTDQKINFRQGYGQEKEDNRPIAVETGDQDVDRDSMAQGQRLMSMDEIEERGQALEKVETEQPTQSGDRFNETDDKDVNDFYSKTDEMVSREEAEKMKAKEIAAKFEADRTKSKGRER